MALERREILLILGVVFLVIGMSPFMGIAYAVVTAAAIYFGIKLFVKWRKKQIQKSVGAGICAVCGSQIEQNKCPKCDDAKVT